MSADNCGNFDGVWYGPTITEMCDIRLREIDRRIQELQDERRRVVQRKAKYSRKQVLNDDRDAS